MKKTYDVTVEWCGYSRGNSVYRVEAENKEEAEEYWYNGDKMSHSVVRDDTEKEVSSSKEVI